MILFSDKVHEIEYAKKIHSQVRDMADQVKWPYKNFGSFYSSRLMDFSAHTLKYITDHVDCPPVDDPMNDSDEDMFVDLDQNPKQACVSIVIIFCNYCQRTAFIIS
jgi:hypothetical protein